MTEAEERFLKAYSSALNSAEYSGLKSLSTAELRKVFSLADIHSIFPMIFEAVYDQLSNSVIDTRFYKNNIKKAADLTCAQARMTAEFLKLYRFLGSKGLRPIVMKGIICRSLYPNPEQRSSSDEDLLIPAGQFEEYHRALLEYGMEPALPDLDIYKEHEVSYCNSKVYIELHKTPFPPESKAYGDLNRFFEDAEQHKITEMIYGVLVCTMDYTDHIFYQICHAYKHFLNCGIGIRLAGDIVLYSMTHIEKIDWKTVTDRCREIKAYDFVSALFRIGDIYLFPDRFDDRLKQIWNTEETDEEELLKDILAGGIYGTSSNDRLHSSNLTLHAAEQSKTGSRSSALLYTLFPSVDIMKNRYPYLHRFRFLLPCAWIQRIISYAFSSLFHKHSGNNATEAMRIGNERVALMRRYHILEEKKKHGSLLKRIYKWTHRSILSPVLSPLFKAVSMIEYSVLNMIWKIRGYRLPDQNEQKLVHDNVTFIFKSFERQKLAEGLCKNISRMYPGVSIIIADDSHKPLSVDLPNVKVIHLPFNSGLSAGLQAALNDVKTPYVMRMDDDELLTIRSKVHRELNYLIEHTQLDLIGFGHTTAIRLHSPEFNFKEYYKYSMSDAIRPLKIKHLTKIDENHLVLGKVANIYLARTDKMREVGFDPNIKVIDHHEFFWRAAGIMTCAVALDTVVFHRHNPYEKEYNAYRSDYAADLEYIQRKRRQMIREEKENDKSN